LSLICKPRGPGNWRTTVFTVDDARVTPLSLVGSLFTIGGVTFRICEVRP
jgi:hypothetical protein